MALDGARWRSTAFGGAQWRSMALDGARWRPMATDGALRRSTLLYGALRRSMAPDGARVAYHRLDQLDRRAEAEVGEGSEALQTLLRRMMVRSCMHIG